MSRFWVRVIANGACLQRLGYCYLLATALTILSTDSSRRGSLGHVLPSTSTCSLVRISDTDRDLVSPIAPQIAYCIASKAWSSSEEGSNTADVVIPAENADIPAVSGLGSSQSRVKGAMLLFTPRIMVEGTRTTENAGKSARCSVTIAGSAPQLFRVRSGVSDVCGSGQLPIWLRCSSVVSLSAATEL